MSSTSKIPQLPHTDDGESASLRHEVKPAIALNTLTTIYQKVQQYQVELRKLTYKIRQVYAEGPIVSGWLASEASLSAAVKQSNASNQQLGEADVALFRHGDTADLMNYLSALESGEGENGKLANPTVNPVSTVSTIEPDVLTQKSQGSSSANKSSQYYLCRLTSCGRIQTEECPPEQVPVLSMAIARYQRLNQLTKQKQTIETKLQAIMDILEDIERVIAD